MSEKFLRALSGIDNLKATAIFRMIVGLVIVIYGFILFSLTALDEFWTKISVPSALWALGLMFIFDGSSILREYFKSNRKIESEPTRQLSPLIKSIKLLFIIGSLLFFIKFSMQESPSLYPLVIYLLGIFLVSVFYDKISHLKISREGVEMSLNQIPAIKKELNNLIYEINESKKPLWNFEVKKEEKQNVQTRKN